MAGVNAADKADAAKTKRGATDSRVTGLALIVLDASVVVELLTNATLAEALRRDLAEHSDPLIVPHLLDIEVASALRNLVAGQRIDSHRSEQLLSGLGSLPAERYSHIPLLTRMWELRHNFTAYDAAYIALAEITGSVLYTCDEKLSKGHRAQVQLFT
jgi:predicted nucleic acid-binding protein